MKTALGYLTLCLVWGSTYLLIKVVLEGFAPYFMAGVRFLCAGVLILPVLLRNSARLPRELREWLAIVVAGALMLTGANGLITWAEVYLDSGLTALTVCTTPVWSSLIGSWFFSREERFDRWMLLGTVISLAGVVYLHHERLNLSNDQLPGVIGAFLAPMLWAWGSLIVRHHVRHTDMLSLVALQMLSSSWLFFLVSLIIGESWHAELSSRIITAMAGLIVVGSSLVYAVYAWLLKRMRASRLTTYAYVNPLVAVVLGNLILNEPITHEVLPATVLILGGLLLMYSTRNRKQSAKAMV